VDAIDNLGVELTAPQGHLQGGDEAEPGIVAHALRPVLPLAPAGAPCSRWLPLAPAGPPCAPCSRLTHLHPRAPAPA
jgi:hypothetical protein